MRMPQLLSGHTMTPAGILRPVSMQLSLKMDGLSTASIVLDSESPDVAIGAWVQIWAPNGEMCVMYVKNRKKDYITGNLTLTLEHTFGLLEEMVVFGEVTAETMSGTVGATTCSVFQAITYLLNQQTETLFTMAAADCDFSDAQGWKFTNSDIYSDMNTLTDAIQNCQWEFNQESLPWALKLKAWPLASTMEMRRNRNLETLQITYDRSGMYTRVYPTGKNNLHIDSVNNNVSYMDQNTGIYGVIANVITDSTIGDANLLKAWAQKQLARNSVPKVSVSISGYELSQATGESLDKFIIGRMCRIPLPEYGETVMERMSELTWKNCIAQPEDVTVTLANELKTITGVLNEKARSGGGGSKKANTEHDCELEEDEVKIEEFDNSDIWINRDNIWAVCAQYDVITDSQGKHIRLKDGALLEINRDGIYQTVGTIISDQDASIGALDTWVDTFEGSALWTQRDNITGVCGEYEVVYYTESGVRKKKLRIKNGTGLVMQRNGADFGVYDDGTLTGGICISKINSDSGNPIYSSRVDLTGYVTTTMMESAFQDIAQATIGQLTVSGSLFTFDGYDVDWKSQYILYSLNYDSYHNYDTTDAGNHRARYATGANGTTIYYMGR